MEAPRQEPVIDAEMPIDEDSPSVSKTVISESALSASLMKELQQDSLDNGRPEAEIIQNFESFWLNATAVNGTDESAQRNQTVFSSGSGSNEYNYTVGSA